MTSTVTTQRPVLSLSQLNVEFKVAGRWKSVISDVSLDIAPGEAVAIVGESGSGKSATALSIIGQLPPNGRIRSGGVTLDGTDLESLPKKRGRTIRGLNIGFVFQDPQASLNPVLTIGRQLTEHMRRHQKLSRAEAEERARWLLEQVGISHPGDRLSDYPFQFSGGMRQRIALAVALACRPKVIIADEPTTALDVTVQAQILKLLATIQAEQDVALILITHDLSVAALVADRIAVMYAGRLVEVADAQSISRNPRHPYTRRLWQAMPDIESGAIPAGIPGRPPALGELRDRCAFAPRCDHATDLCSRVPLAEAVNTSHEVACWRWKDIS